MGKSPLAAGKHLSDNWNVKKQDLREMLLIRFLFSQLFN